MVLLSKQQETGASEQGDGDGDDGEGQRSGVQREVERQLSSLLVLPWLLRGCHTQQKSVIVASERRAAWS